MVEVGNAMTVPVVSFKNVLEIIAEVEQYHEEARLLVAGKLLAEVDRYLASGRHTGRAEVKAALELLGGELKASFDQVRQRAEECSSTLEDWHAPDWLLAQKFMGVTTFYKQDPDGSLWIKMHGTMDNVGVMEQLATVREVDLFKKWVPFCNTSRLLTRLGIVELIVYLAMSAPGVVRDTILHAYGCDSVLEDRCILIIGRSVEEVPQGAEVPEAKGWGRGRMDVRAFKVKIEILSPTSARTSIVTNIDPNAPVPQAVVNFMVRKVAGMFLYCLKQTATCIRTDERNFHRQRIEEDEAFYRNWLFPRLERFYRQQGWPVGDALGVEGNDTSQVVEPSDGRCCPSGSIKFAPPRPRKSFGLKTGSRLKHALKHRRLTRRRKEQQPVEMPQPQVESLDIDARLLEKWQARRAVRRGGTNGARLLFSLLSAMLGAFIRWACASEERAAVRLRSIVRVLCALLLASVFIFCVLV